MGNFCTLYTACFSDQDEHCWHVFPIDPVRRSQFCILYRNKDDCHWHVALNNPFVKKTSHNVCICRVWSLNELHLHDLLGVESCQKKLHIQNMKSFFCFFCWNDFCPHDHPNEAFGTTVFTFENLQFFVNFINMTFQMMFMGSVVRSFTVVAFQW